MKKYLLILIFIIISLYFLNLLNSIWFSYLPLEILQKLGPLSLVVVGYLVEKKFVGRIATFSNSIAFNLHIISVPKPDQLLIYYANIGLIMGILAIFSYKGQESMPKLFYLLS